MTIRKATLDDASGILECLRLAFEPYRERYAPAAFEDTVMSPSSIRHRLSDMTVFVALTGTAEIVGTIGCKALDGGEGHIRGMAVHPARAGTGLSRLLLQVAETALAARGCSRVTLDTTAPLERAVRFYVRNGFRSTGAVRDFFGMPLFEYAKPLQTAAADDPGHALSS
jgi:[ribosomal protein S18]-alanine N-acetyltransferase